MKKKILADSNGFWLFRDLIFIFLQKPRPLFVWDFSPFLPAVEEKETKENRRCDKKAKNASVLLKISMLQALYQAIISFVPKTLSFY